MKPLNSNNANNLPLDTAVKQKIALQFLPLDKELLIKRIVQGGHSGEFLRDAFISAYRTNINFRHSLGETIRLDAEAIQLFHAILSIRLIPGWTDTELYELEQDIIRLGASA